ncbi:MAG: RiPP maturation radical SAM protein 1 [Planctomycetes bacterium]|nr:RiPP maturation radical SAM protein 1 [Planctomycetota bacterium]
MSRVLLFNMPFFNLRWPNLGLSLLKAGLKRRGIGCDIAYLNFDLAERIGTEHYTWIADCFAFVLGGERLFALDLFDGLPDDESFYREVLLPADPEMSRDDFRCYQSLKRHIGPFLDQAAAAVDWSQYAVVGFSTSFQQTLASLALARRIKRIAPDVAIVLGGAACEGPMGIELLRQFPQVDFVFLGEADETFPRFVQTVLAGRTPGNLPGVVSRDCLPVDDGRDPSATGCGVGSEMVENLDALPFPDFDDYFERLQQSPLRDEIDPMFFFETARGCWWGQKHHCTFCGLNGATMSYRSKSPERAQNELTHLAARYPVRRACAADNILDFRHFRSLLPMLREARLELQFIYEVKPNLTREQVRSLLEAGLGGVQLGIETFSTPILRQIHKGATALQNLRTLKWFTEAGVEVEWNLLYGFPDEDPDEYRPLAELLPSLFHLAPPLAIGRVRPDRFSPYFQWPERYGIENLRPHRAFRFVYPFDESVLRQIAYYHEFDYADGREPLRYAAPVVEAAQRWQQLAGTVTFRFFDRGDGTLILHDTRPCATSFLTLLTGLDRRIYLACDAGCTLSRLTELLQSQASSAAPSSAVDSADILRRLRRLVASRLMAYVDDHYLSLAINSESDLVGHS